MSSVLSLLRVVYVTVPNEEIAKKIARFIVENKLAACVNIVNNIKSVYTWENKVTEEDEILLIIKTQQSQLKPLEQEIIKLHPYEVPEFISLPIDHASEPYAKWVQEQTLKK